MILRNVKYIVPEHCRGIKIAQSVIDEMVRRCAEESHFSKVVLLGAFNDLVYICWCGGKLPRYGSMPVVFGVDEQGHIKDLLPLDGMGVIGAVVNNGFDETLLDD